MDIKKRGVEKQGNEKWNSGSWEEGQNISRGCRTKRSIIEKGQRGTTSTVESIEKEHVYREGLWKRGGGHLRKREKKASYRSAAGKKMSQVRSKKD